MKNFLKAVLKWAAIIGGAAIVGWWLEDKSFTTIAMIAFVFMVLRTNHIEASLKDRIEMLEYRLDQHAEKLDGY